MAIAYVKSADLGDNGGSGTLTVAFTAVGGSTHRLVLGIAGDLTTDNVTAASFNAVSMTQMLKNVGTGSNDRTNYQYSLDAPAAGTHNVVITANVSTYIIAVIAEYSGMQSASQPDGTNAAVSISPVTCTITVGTANAWGVMTGSGFNSNVPPTAGAGSTLRIAGSFGAIALFDSNGDLAAGSRSMIYSYGGGSLASGCMVTYKPDTTPVTSYPAPYYAALRTA